MFGQVRTRVDRDRRLKNTFEGLRPRTSALWLKLQCIWPSTYALEAKHARLALLGDRSGPAASPVAERTRCSTCWPRFAAVQARPKLGLWGICFQYARMDALHCSIRAHPIRHVAEHGLRP